MTLQYNDNGTIQSLARLFQTDVDYCDEMLIDSIMQTHPSSVNNTDVYDQVNAMVDYLKLVNGTPIHQFFQPNVNVLNGTKYMTENEIFHSLRQERTPSDFNDPLVAMDLTTWRKNWTESWVTETYNKTFGTPISYELPSEPVPFPSEHLTFRSAIEVQSVTKSVAASESSTLRSLYNENELRSFTLN